MRGTGKTVSPARPTASSDLKPEFTYDELVQALLAAESTDGGQNVETALTTIEIQELLGWYEKKVLEGLRALSRAGRLECVWVRRINISGKTGSVPAYRLKTGVRAE